MAILDIHLTDDITLWRSLKAHEYIRKPLSVVVSEALYQENTMVNTNTHTHTHKHTQNRHTHTHTYIHTYIHTQHKHTHTDKQTNKQTHNGSFFSASSISTK